VTSLITTQEGAFTRPPSTESHTRQDEAISTVCEHFVEVVRSVFICNQYDLVFSYSFPDDDVLLQCPLGCFFGNEIKQQSSDQNTAIQRSCYSPPQQEHPHTNVSFESKRRLMIRPKRDLFDQVLPSRSVPFVQPIRLRKKSLSRLSIPGVRIIDYRARNAIYYPQIYFIILC
jgi:hypothetical protein